MKKITYLAIAICFFATQLSLSQSINNWTLKQESEISKNRQNLKRENIPNKYKTFYLDVEALKGTMANAVVRNKDGKLSRTVLASFPFEDGSTETFAIEKVNVLHPDLGAKYPEIQSYEGTSIDNRFNKIYISMYNKEFRGLITGDKTIYIDPYAKNDVENYIVYNRSDLNRKSDDNFVCNTIDENLDIKPIENNGIAHRNSTDGKLRTYDIAIACTSEYTAYHGNTVAGALAAVNTTITRVNSVYKRDLGVVFQIVAGNNRLIYRNEVNIDPTPDPDPYDNYDGSQMLNANTSNINGIIGSANYDIGHVFSTGGGGIAGTGPCATTKGTGVTGIVTPEFDPFDIDYVCHEIGHQFGAGHTQNNACQISTTSAMEPGSGSTILGYAGICPPNIQNNSDAYFHAISIQQMTASINSHTCETETTIANAEPVITAVPNYTIPKSTPFILTASATDADGDAMTYCWEQMNNGTSSGTMPPVSTSTNRPAFRSLFPTTSPSRTFPNLPDLINNVTPTWEVLPSVARTLNFRLTVRDNNSLGGQTNQANTTITVGTAGPFAVTAPNTAETWYVGESKTVTWSVNSTNTATYSANVNIKLSTDGGFTYPITLLSGTPNDGSQAITVPNNIGTQNRIKVEAAANIFFDISNANFEIKSNKFALTSSASTVSVCKPSSGTFTINYAPAPGFSETVTFSAIGLPTGATASFSPTSRNTAGTVTMTINGISSVATGTHNFNFNGTSTTSNINLPVTLKVFDSNIGTVIPSSPANGAENQQTSVLLGWNALANAASYTVEISANPSFSTLLETASVTTNSYQTTSLSNGTINYWRIRPVNSCLTGSYSETFSFQIASDYCRNYVDEYFDGNNIWELNTTNAVIAKMDVPDDVIISKVSFYMRATHASIADIKMQLSGPSGIFAEIFNRDCSGANIDITFDDSGVPLTCGNIDPATSAAFEGIQQPSQPLSKFNGSSSLGTWTLLATDRGANASGGTFHEFSIRICGKLQIVNNIVVDKEVQNVSSGATVVLTSAKLLASQPTATGTNLVYTLTQLPANGVLKNNGTTLGVGSTFTQANIDSNLITYTHNGTNTNPESFKFSVTGLNSAYIGGESFTFNVCTVTNTSSQNNVLCFGNATGSASVVASGGTAPYTYLWSPSGGTSATASNLAAGNYTCIITDASGCTKEQSFTITQPTATISNTVSQVNVLCFGSNTGSATVVASGGTGAFTYLWSPSGGTSATASNLSAGNYSVRITDANGCFKDQAFTITQPTAAISNTVSQVNVLCFGSNTGSATVAVSGGTGAFTYLWSPSGGTSATASNLSAGNYSVRITDANGCFKDQAFTITQPTATISNTVSQVNVLCFGSNTGSATVAASGGTGAFTYLWSPSGGTSATASNLSAGNYSVRITDANGCFKDQAFTITQPTAAISNTVSQVNVSCFGENNGSATVIPSGGSGGYTYLWSPSGGTAATATGLIAGNYSCLITDSNGCIKTQSFTITQPVATIWNGTTWSNGLPVAGTKAIFNSSFTSNGDLTACSIEVNNNAVVTVLSGHDFNIANKVTVAETAQLIFQNNANLIQTDEVANSGNITSNRIAMMRRQDYVYWSSPVLGQNLLDFSPLTLVNRFYTLDEPSNGFVMIDPVQNDFSIAKGFMVRAPNTFPNSITQFDGKFTGIPNNGIKTIGVTSIGDGFNMIGNPYPSTVNAYLFLDINPGTLYFWTHTTQVSTGPSNYATFNTLGGTAAAAGGPVPNGSIQVGQGFLIQKDVAATTTFNNGMRTGNNAGQFFRNSSQKHRIWLNLNSATTPFNQILIGYMEGATQGKDESIDGILIDNGTSISSKIGESNFTIQGRALPFDTNDVVPLNFNAVSSGSYTLSIDHTDGIFSGNQNIYLKDKLSNIIHDIKQSAYNFISEAGSYATRFEIVYTNTTLGVTPTIDENNLIVYIQDDVFNLKSVNIDMKAVKIFDIRGRLIYEKSNIKSGFTTLTDFRAEQQVVLVQVEFENGIVITKKAAY